MSESIIQSCTANERLSEPGGPPPRPGSGSGSGTTRLATRLIDHAVIISTGRMSAASINRRILRVRAAIVASLVQAALSLAVTFCTSAAALAFTYQIDDGTAERGHAPFRGGAMAWLNSFEVQPGGTTLTSIDINLGAEIHNLAYPVSVHIWLDPTNDGDPIDATVVRTVQALTNPSGEFVNVPIEPLTLPVGTWFFAGGFFVQPADAPSVVYPVWIDLNDPVLPNRSFISNWHNAASADPNHLSAGAFFYGPASDGNYLIRVNAVPEPSSWLLLALGLLWSLSARVRSVAGKSRFALPLLVNAHSRP